MSDIHDVAVIVGSLRKGSYNRMAAKVLMGLAPQNLKLEIVEIRDLSLYNQDLDDDPPQPWVEFRQRVARAEAVLFVTPEYNRSVPGVLKNAIDIGSRPYGHSVFEGKPAAVVSVSPGAFGGFGANHNLRQSLVFLNMPAMPQPEAYIGGAGSLFDEQGNLTNDKTTEFLRRFIAAYAEWVDRHVPAG